MCIRKDHRIRSALFALPLLVILSVVGATNQAQAATIEWTLNNAVFDDGGSATGSFAWDTVLNRPVSWNFSVSDGDTTNFPEILYSNTLADHILQASNQGGGFLLNTMIMSPSLRVLRFGISDSSLLNTPSSSLPIIGLLVGTGSTGFLECYNCNPVRLGVEGAFFSSLMPPVPIPAAVWLFGTALIGLVGFSKRRKVT